MECSGHKSTNFENSISMKFIILFFQEVDTEYYTSHLNPDMLKFGYNGVVSADNKYSVGQATFWRQVDPMTHTHQSFSLHLSDTLNKPTQTGNFIGNLSTNSPTINFSLTIVDVIIAAIEHNERIPRHNWQTFQSEQRILRQSW